MSRDVLWVFLIINLAGIALNSHGIYVHANDPFWSILGFGANTFCAGWFAAQLVWRNHQ